MLSGKVPQGCPQPALQWVSPIQWLVLNTFSSSTGMSGFHFRGGGSIEPPKNWGGGVREKGSIERHH